MTLMLSQKQINSNNGGKTMENKKGFVIVMSVPKSILTEIKKEQLKIKIEKVSGLVGLSWIKNNESLNDCSKEGAFINTNLQNGNLSPFK